MKRHEALLELQEVIAAYWASVDRVADVSRASASFYVRNGEMALGGLIVRGREALESFFTTRNQKEIENRRTTRHVVSNLRVEGLAPGRATVHALILVYSGIGEWPLTSAPPSAIGDFTFQCVCESPHAWLFEKVSGISVFVGAGAPNFATTKPG